MTPSFLQTGQSLLPSAELLTPGTLGNRLLRMLVGVVFVLAIGFLDYVTGYEIAIFPFYAIPILFLVWEGDLHGALLIAILSAIAWWTTDHASGHAYSREWIRVWDLIVRSTFFCLVLAPGVATKHWGDSNRERIELLERSRDLESQIIDISEHEHQRIGRDLHDGFCHYLASIRFAALSLSQAAAEIDPGFAKDARELADSLEEATRTARSLARGLSPVDCDEGGLESALQELATSTSRLAGIPCTFIGYSFDLPIENHLAVDLFRFAQEALNNAVRHSRGTTVVIAVEMNGSELVLRVSDDRIGIPGGRGCHGMGLNIMHFRAHRIGGKLEISGNVPAGTVVSCIVPAIELRPSCPIVSLI